MSALPSLTTLLLRLWHHIGARRRRQFVALLALMIASVFAELVSLGAALPFIAVLAEPERAFRYPVVVRIAGVFGISTAADLILPLTIVFALVALAAAAVRMLLGWASTRLSFTTGAEIGLDVYRRTLYQPYETHIARSSSEVISGVATKVGTTMLSVLLPGVLFISSVMLVVSIVVALIVIDPFVALVSSIAFGASYAAISSLTNRKLRRNSEVISRAYNEVVKALQEGLGGIRDVLLDGTQSYYTEVYRRADAALRRAQGNNVFISQLPRPPIEAFGMVLIAVLAYGLTRRDGGLASALPVLVALALGAQRLLPALQQAFASWTTILGSHAILADTIKLLEQPLPPEALLPPPEPLQLNRAIQFHDVRFRYHPDGPWIVDGLNLTIPRGARVGFVGATGSGKTTTMDLLMGLLPVTQGVITVDDVPIGRDLIRAWQRTIAHVPQSIYLADASLAENIALGVERHLIDLERVAEAARRAQIAEFVESRPLGYDEVVGERGVRLSGGQRQRIGIARALYKRASVLVLDEATSALDNMTEKSVMEAIEALDRDLTILLIAHRLSTVRRCDIIVQLEQGRVAAMGTYDQLFDSSQTFRQMARAATF
jgi:ATP-binding cassette subfamily B protein